MFHPIGLWPQLLIVIADATNLTEKPHVLVVLLFYLVESANNISFHFYHFNCIGNFNADTSDDLVQVCFSLYLLEVRKRLDVATDTSSFISEAALTDATNDLEQEKECVRFDAGRPIVHQLHISGYNADFGNGGLNVASTLLLIRSVSLTTLTSLTISYHSPEPSSFHHC